MTEPRPVESTFTNRKVLVTGGLGFIGSNLGRRLAEAGAKVTLVDSLVPEYGGNPFNISGYHDRLRINISDVRDEHSFAWLVRDQDFLFNLAGQTSHMDSMRDPFTDMEINCRSQLSILETCRKFNPSIRIVFASTRQIYGRPAYLPVDEKHLLQPVDVNGVNKMAGESYHVLYHNVYGLRACALRLTNTYGPRMRIRDDRQTFLGTWIRAVVEKRPFEVWGGSQKRDFNHVDDVVDALLLAIASDKTAGQVFNLGSDEVVSLREVAEALVESNPGASFFQRDFPAERRRIDIGDYYADFKLIQESVGWTPRVRLKQGLAQTVTYFRENLKHYTE